MKNYSFFAIVDLADGGLVSIIHEKYGEVKAIFTDRELAEQCLTKQTTGRKFMIKEVEIISK